MGAMANVQIAPSEPRCRVCRRPSRRPGLCPRCGFRQQDSDRRFEAWVVSGRDKKVPNGVPLNPRFLRNRGDRNLPPNPRGGDADERRSRPSRTALLVQQAMLYSATRASTAHLVEDEAQQAIREVLENLPEGRKALAELERRRWFVSLREWALLPGASVHHAVRKRWVANQVDRALADGVKQVLVLGAGLDTLGLRLARRNPELTVVEVDHPSSLARKRLAVGPTSGLDLVACDFANTRLPEALGDSAFSPSRPTVVVCEGVLPYLSREETQVLFEDVRTLVGAASTVLCTFLAQHSPTGRAPYGPLMLAYASLVGEPLRSQMSPEELTALLAGVGWDVQEVTHTPALLESAFPAPLYRGSIHDLEMFARVAC